MLDDALLVPIALFVSLALTIIGLARIISEGRTRRRLIDAGGSAEVARALAANQDEHGRRLASRADPRRDATA